MQPTFSHYRSVFGCVFCNAIFNTQAYEEPPSATERMSLMATAFYQLYVHAQVLPTMYDFGAHWMSPCLQHARRSEGFAQHTKRSVGQVLSTWRRLQSPDITTVVLFSSSGSVAKIGTLEQDETFLCRLNITVRSPHYYQDYILKCFFDCDSN